MTTKNEQIEQDIREAQKAKPDERIGQLLAILDREREEHLLTKRDLAKAMEEVVAARGLKVNQPTHEAPKPVTRRA
jgi:hypothetical protein